MVAVAGGLAVTTDSSEGTAVIDVSDPARPSVAGSFTFPGSVLNVRMDRAFAYVAAGPGGQSLTRYGARPS
jgi:hypothetical protein